MFEWLHESHFWGLFLKFLKNGKNFFWRFWHQRVPPLEKNRKYQKKSFFWKKSYFFFLNLYCTCSKLSFDVYNSHVSKNFEFWHIFAWKFSFFAIVFRQPDWPKLQLIECCFWCLWTAKDQKNWMEVNFGLYDAFRQLQDDWNPSNHNGAPSCDNVIPKLVWNRVKKKPSKHVK